MSARHGRQPNRYVRANFACHRADTVCFTSVSRNASESEGEVALLLAMTPVRPATPTGLVGLAEGFALALPAITTKLLSHLPEAAHTIH
ncbi:MAG: hypothetical protein AAF626_16910 [Pseudomonadota bacterium]